MAESKSDRSQGKAKTQRRRAPSRVLGKVKTDGEAIFCANYTTLVVIILGRVNHGLVRQVRTEAKRRGVTPVFKHDDAGRYDTTLL